MNILPHKETGTKAKLGEIYVNEKNFYVATVIAWVDKGHVVFRTAEGRTKEQAIENVVKAWNKVNE